MFIYNAVDGNNICVALYGFLHNIFYTKVIFFPDFDWLIKNIENIILALPSELQLAELQLANTISSQIYWPYPRLV